MSLTKITQQASLQSEDFNMGLPDLSLQLLSAITHWLLERMLGADKFSSWGEGYGKRQCITVPKRAPPKQQKALGGGGRHLNA